MGRAALEKAMSNRKGGDDRYKWTQMLLSPDVHKRLKHLALDRGVTLKELLEDIVTNFINKESSYGRNNTRSTSNSKKT